jgi:hypothetical protein
MRKLQDRQNVFAENGRLTKAARLAVCIADALDRPIDDALLETLHTQSAEWWASLASDCGCHAPSPACVEATLGLLSQNRTRIQHPADPLEGLPTP